MTCSILSNGTFLKIYIYLKSTYITWGVQNRWQQARLLYQVSPGVNHKSLQHPIIPYIYIFKSACSGEFKTVVSRCTWLDQVSSTKVSSNPHLLLPYINPPNRAAAH